MCFQMADRVMPILWPRNSPETKSPLFSLRYDSNRSLVFMILCLRVNRDASSASAGKIRQSGASFPGSLHGRRSLRCMLPSDPAGFHFRYHKPFAALSSSENTCRTGCDRCCQEAEELQPVLSCFQFGMGTSPEMRPMASVRIQPRFFSDTRIRDHPSSDLSWCTTVPSWRLKSTVSAL